MELSGQLYTSVLLHREEPPVPTEQDVMTKKKIPVPVRSRISLVQLVARHFTEWAIHTLFSVKYKTNKDYLYCNFIITMNIFSVIKTLFLIYFYVKECTVAIRSILKTY
jgi:hypothetical protein